MVSDLIIPQFGQVICDVRMTKAISELASELRIIPLSNWASLRAANKLALHDEALTLRRTFASSGRQSRKIRPVDAAIMVRSITVPICQTNTIMLASWV